MCRVSFASAKGVLLRKYSKTTGKICFTNRRHWQYHFWTEMRGRCGNRDPRDASGSRPGNEAVREASSNLLSNAVGFVQAISTSGPWGQLWYSWDSVCSKNGSLMQTLSKLLYVFCEPRWSLSLPCVTRDYSRKHSQFVSAASTTCLWIIKTNGKQCWRKPNLWVSWTSHRQTPSVLSRVRNRQRLHFRVFVCFSSSLSAN